MKVSSQKIIKRIAESILSKNGTIIDEIKTFKSNLVSTNFSCNYWIEVRKELGGIFGKLVFHIKTKDVRYLKISADIDDIGLNEISVELTNNSYITSYDKIYIKPGIKLDVGKFDDIQLSGLSNSAKEFLFYF